MINIKLVNKLEFAVQFEYRYKVEASFEVRLHIFPSSIGKALSGVIDSVWGIFFWFIKQFIVYTYTYHCICKSMIRPLATSTTTNK